MQSSFLHPIYSQLTKIEWRQLQKFVASPYFNGRNQLNPLVTFLSEAYLNNSIPSKTSVFQHVFPDIPFDDQLWRLSISQLYKLTEQWLAIRAIQKDIRYPKFQLLPFYRTNNLEGHYLRTEKHLQKTVNKIAQKDADYYEMQYQIEWEQYRFLSTGKRTASFNLQAVSDSMDLAYMARKLRYACLAISHQTVYKTQYDLGLLQHLTVYLNEHPKLLDHPALGLYYYCYLAFTENDESHFQTFIELLGRHSNALPLVELRNLHLLAINFGIRQINASRSTYDLPVLELYQLALKNDLLLENGRLSHFAFNNIVAIGVRKGAIEWIETFIHNYQSKLERRHRKVAFSLGMARIEHARKNYGAALLQLQQADYKDFINNIIAKTLQMKIYFETGEYEVLDPHLRNMKTYIKRQRAFGYHRDNYLNIIKFTRAIMDLPPFDKKAKEDLREAIKSLGRLTERTWLLDMLDR